MTEQEYVSALQEGIPEAAPVTAALLELSDDAVRDHPKSRSLWLLRGCLIQLGEGMERWTLDDAVESYERALELSPDDPEVHEQLGYWYDVVEVQLERAAQHFSKALSEGGGRDSYVGMARVLAELGGATEALNLLRSSDCPHREEPEVQELIGEIEGGLWAP